MMVLQVSNETIRSNRRTHTRRLSRLSEACLQPILDLNLTQHFIGREPLHRRRASDTN